MLFGNQVNSAWMRGFFAEPTGLKVFFYKKSMIIQYLIILKWRLMSFKLRDDEKIKSCSVLSTLLKMAIFTNTCLGARKVL